MDLILWRHAEAEDAGGGLPDTCRRLTDRGERQARVTARWLEKRLPLNTRILASPAQRTQMTAHTLGRPFVVEPLICIGASPIELLTAADWPNRGGTVIIVGHQPALGRLAALISTGKESDWKVKKGGLWWFSARGRGDELQATLRAVIQPVCAKESGAASEPVLLDRSLSAAKLAAAGVKGRLLQAVDTHARI